MEGMPSTSALSDTASPRRQIFIGLAVVLIVLGLGIRSRQGSFPSCIAAYAPDALWAMLVFCLVVVCFPHLPTIKAVVVAVAFAYFIEFTQIYQDAWINHLRASRIGSLILGHGFLWSDLVCYSAGITFGATIDILYGRRYSAPT
jgi:hypothetical protein